jgi:hypothetical protein
MPVLLSSFGRELVLDERAFRERYTTPFLVWEAPRVEAEEVLFSTQVSGPLSRPGGLQSLGFALKKGGAASNAFTMGITVGRTENNDVHIPDNSVSRFHAYFQQDAKGGPGWRLVDAESKNGTFVDDERLAGNGSRNLTDGVCVRFGNVSLRFLLPEAFVEYLRKMPPS